MDQPDIDCSATRSALAVPLTFAGRVLVDARQWNPAEAEWIMDNAGCLTPQSFGNGMGDVESVGCLPISVCWVLKF